jgi:hypothetical protein
LFVQQIQLDTFLRFILTVVTLFTLFRLLRRHTLFSRIRDARRAVSLIKKRQFGARLRLILTPETSTAFLGFPGGNTFFLRFRVAAVTIFGLQ